MRDFIAAELVPVWLDVRALPLPEEPTFDSVLGTTRLDEARRVDDTFSQGFFLRSLVLAPDTLALLNPQDATPEASLETWKQRGYFSYAQVNSEDYLPMLREAVARWRSLKLARGEP
ncbi:MAG: hypothetical protein IT380_25340 [Myxococcales bacterium]|nr:hypothetical protein [Myxococcales bacterium]